MSNHTSSVTNVDRLTAEVECRFVGFANLPSTKGLSFTNSSGFTCFGHQWHLRVWPGGDNRSKSGHVAVFLYHDSPGSIELQTDFVIKSPDGTAVKKFLLQKHIWAESGGVTDLLKRSAAIGALHDGALVVQVRMVKPAQFAPTNPLGKNILKRFMDEQSSDVVFEVSKDEVGGGRKTRKRAKMSPPKFYAHELILEGNAPALAEACKLRNGLDPIPITGIDPEIFRKVLYYVYGGKLEDEYMETNAKGIIEAADKLGVVHLKLEVEARYVESDPINFENVLDNIAYADAMSCPLLKEAAMDFLVKHGDEAVQKLSFKDVPGEVIADLLTAMNTGKKPAGKSGDEFNTMRISELRRKLDEKGLDVDGSREAMIAALKESSSVVE